MGTTHICQKRKTCRICGASTLKPVLDLGQQCLASIFESGSPPDWLQQPYPLDLVRCAAPDGCGLVQLGHSISPRVLYSHYGYRSGINELMRQNLIEIARIAEDMVGLRPGDTVCDIGCNDGTFLDALSTKGVDKIGIDPAANVVRLARDKGLEVVCDFFSKEVYEKARPGIKPKIIATIAMFYDLDDPVSFVRDIASILADDGVWAMEMSYLPFMLKNTAFDAICHEHRAYYSLRQLEWLFAREQLNIHRIEFNDINGGSLRLFIRKQTAGGDVALETVQALIRIREEERSLALDTSAPYHSFYEAALAVRHELQYLLQGIRSRGETIYAYGASTKGNIILQFCGINNRLVSKAADRNPDKWSCRTPATGIEIISEQQAREEKPDFFLVLPWSFITAFKAREAVFLKRGGRFILPLPKVRIIGANGEVEYDRR
ncbi:MAG: class I SAM-dependent methyltransferase [Thermodesulfobacteriota bacterium]